MATVVAVAGDEAFQVVGEAVGGGAVGGMTAVEFRAEFTGAISQ